MKTQRAIESAGAEQQGALHIIEKASADPWSIAIKIVETRMVHKKFGKAWEQEREKEEETEHGFFR